ncbi:MAG TPA: hypothetical protein VFI74_05180 [Candidatus Saccharimonadales bacterium]|nr:hypothetical protein [Candidatus Saccharimonadales bacterium]
MPEQAYAPHSEQTLHERLIAYDCNEFVYDEHLVERPTLEIVGDAKVAINGMVMALDARDTFVLNELRLTQGYGIDVEELVALGFRGDVSRATAVTARLAASVNSYGKETYIEQYVDDDGALTAVLMPEVQVLDRRAEAQQPVFNGEVVDDGIVRDATGAITILPTGGIYFKAPRFRAAVTLAMLRDFGQWAQADAWFDELFEGRRGQRLGSTILPLHFLPPLTREQENILLAQKEEALLQYIQLQDFPDQTQMTAIADGVYAYYELFAHNLDLVHLLARSNNRKVAYADLYQEGAAQVLQAVLNIGLNYERKTDFRTIAHNNIRRRGKRGTIPLYYDSVLPPGTFPYSQVARLSNFKHELRQLREAGQPFPSVDAWCERLSLGRDTVLGLLSVSQEQLYLDDTDKAQVETEGQRVLHHEDFSDDLIDQLNNKAMVAAVFSAAPLSLEQKVVLSVCYGVFNEALAGQALSREGEVIMTYPDTPEDLEALCKKFPSLTAIGSEMLGMHAEHARRLHDRALLKVRDFLRQHSAYDTLDRIDIYEVERQALVDAALLLSPDKRLGVQGIRQAASDGALPAGEERICKLFGSIPAFQRACGFTPDRGQAVTRALSDDEIIAMAKKLQPDQPLRARQIRDYSRLNQFVSLQTVLGRWDSLPNFQRACGF